MTLAGRKKVVCEDIAPPSRGQNSSIPKSNVRVVVRIRPENKLEIDADSRVVVQYMNENVLVFDPKEQGSPEYGYRRRRRQRDIRRRENKDLRFAFDYVFGPRSKNHEVYEQTTKQIVTSFLNGYNCSVFAYGATGAGKTHTMLGSPEHPGVMYLTMMELYSRMAVIEADQTCDIAVSYLEVYNEQIHDLLLPGNSLPVREDSRSGVVVPGLSLHKIAKMCLVDLAGSERATCTKNRGARLREGANINRSLLALGNVINSLSDSKYKGHIPYRDSKLTRLLKDSLGGNCQTCMIAAVSPSSLTYEDTYNTLKYADRAKNIQSTLKKNVLKVDFHVAKYGQIIEDLRVEIVELKDKLRFYEEGKMVAQSTTNYVEICRMREKLDGVFGTRLKMCQEHLDVELKSRDMQWKIYRKEKCLAWMNLVTDMHQNGLREKMEKTITTSRQRLQNVLKSKEETNHRLEENKKNMKDLEVSVQEQINASGDQLTSEILKSSLEFHQTNLQLTEAQLIVKLLECLKQQYQLLQKENLMTSDLQSNYHSIQSLVGGREVAFADQSYCAASESNTNAEKIEIGDLLNFKSSTNLTVTTDNYCIPSQAPVHSAVSTTQITEIHSEEGPQRIIQEAVIGLPSRVDDKNTVHVIKHNGVPATDFQHQASSERNGQQISQISNPPLGSQALNSGLNNVSAGDSIETKLFAGHTPAPKKLVGVPLESGNNVVSVATDVNSDGIGRVTSVSSLQVPGLHTSNSSQNSCSSSVQINGAKHLTSSQELNSVVLGSSAPVLKNNNTALDSTFTVGDIQASKDFNTGQTKSHEQTEDLNSTFTLDEACPRNPEIVARTPIIDDKYRNRSSNHVNNCSVNNVDTCKSVNNCVNSGVENSSNGNIVRTASTLKPVNKLLENVKNIAHPLQSQTVTKSHDSNYGKEDSVSDKLSVKSQTVTKVKHFDDNNENVKDGGRSYAEVARSPPIGTPSRVQLKEVNGSSTPLGIGTPSRVPFGTPSRVPLREVNGNGTPLANPLSPLVKPEQQKNGLIRNNLFPQCNDSAKENARVLQEYGLPSLVERPSASIPTDLKIEIMNLKNQDGHYHKEVSLHQTYIGVDGKFKVILKCVME
ncbi:hypothetical protein KUTeg_023353 [Tegillarca granosa]|uniref:Kinesin motor domain-containing protein n=1 Tax=Tegillarca granosa TaxID=220873 RepID=A0ABQ9E7K5_TEGGR|nr:hypothetical protein KUTeg_023353 [Tegillarca granosa]